MQAEPAVERQRGAIARSGECEIAVQRRIVGIADRRTAERPSIAPRRMMTPNRGSRAPAALAGAGRKPKPARAPNAPAARTNPRRDREN